MVGVAVLAPRVSPSRRAITQKPTPSAHHDLTATRPAHLQSLGVDAHGDQRTGTPVGAPVVRQKDPGDDFVRHARKRSGDLGGKQDQTRLSTIRYRAKVAIDQRHAAAGRTVSWNGTYRHEHRKQVQQPCRRSRRTRTRRGLGTKLATAAIVCGRCPGRPCDHDQFCCREHNRHVTPHRDRILR